MAKDKDGARLTFRLDSGTLERLEAAAARYGVSRARVLVSLIARGVAADGTMAAPPADAPEVEAAGELPAAWVEQIRALIRDELDGRP